MTDQTTIIQEIAEDVYKPLGSGFSEDVYDRAMQVGLRLAKIGYEGQKVVELKYKEHYVGEGYPDLVVHLGNEKLIVELKAISGELGASEQGNPSSSAEFLASMSSQLFGKVFTIPIPRRLSHTNANLQQVPDAAHVQIIPLCRPSSEYSRFKILNQVLLSRFATYARI